MWVHGFVAVCLIALNMRMSIASVGPLLPQLSASEDIPMGYLGALGSIPLITWAVVSPIAHRLGHRFGMSRTITYALTLLTLGTVWRSLPGNAANLWLGTALIGAALAVGNVLMPAIIKRYFGNRVPLVTGVFSSVVAAAGAIAAGLMVPLAEVFAGPDGRGWRLALLSIGVFAPIALVSWAIAVRNAPATPEVSPIAYPQQRGGTMWSEPVGWQIAIYMGAQSTVFYTLLTWLVAVDSAQGKSAAHAGIDVMILQITGIIGSTVFPILFRGALRRWVPALAAVLILGSCVGMLLLPAGLTWWAGIGGTGLGASYTMALTLMAVKSPDAGTASAVSGMAQSVGYALAAIGPLLFGALHVWSGGWTLPLMLLVAVGVLQCCVGLVVGGPRLIYDRRKSPGLAPNPTHEQKAGS